jgi:peptidoglycan hydrolase-like protein with peptidoglycan-binding domain
MTQAALMSPTAKGPALVIVKPPVVIAPKPPVVVPTPVLPAGPPPSSAPAGRAPTITPALRSLPALLRNGKATKPQYKAPASSGQAVKDWQQVLFDLGFTKAKPDGKFGDATEAATRAFQAAANSAAAKSTPPKKPDSPLPGIIPPMLPTSPDPERALAARLTHMLVTATPGREDRTLVAMFQQRHGLKPTGFYGPAVALALAHRYGIVPPKPLYWTESRTGKSKGNYRDALRMLAERDPQRSEEWIRAGAV